jgi:flagellar biosynthetic protein FliR
MAPILFSTAEIIRFAIVLMRLSGIMVSAPFFSSQSVPMQIRAVFVLVAAFILTPSLPISSVPTDLGLSSIAWVATGEILTGILLGFAASCIFAGFQFAGHIISLQIGFSLINQIDPQTNVEVSVFSFLQNYMGLLLFLLINGHHWFLLAINESFGVLPVGGIQISGSVIEQLIYLSGQVFVIGLRISGPVLVVSIIADVVMAIIGRAAPQIHILIVSMPLKILVGFGCLSLSFYFLPHYLESVYTSLFKTLFSFVRVMN